MSARWLALTLFLAPVVGGQAFAADRSELRTEGPSVGQAAPDFELRKLESDETVTLSTVAANRPVVLVFGSYT